MEHGRVVSLQLCKEHREPMSPTQKAVAISGIGLEGDRHAIKGNPRQVLLVDKETLDTLDVAPGTVKENITVEGLDFSAIQAGQVFFIGDEVTLEATGICVRCSRMDEIRPGLQQALDGRGGMLAMVLNGGKIKVGDAVRVEPSREAIQTEAARQ